MSQRSFLRVVALGLLTVPACRDSSGPEIRSGFFPVPGACGSLAAAASGEIFVFSEQPPASLRIESREADGEVNWATTVPSSSSTCNGSIDLAGNLVTPTADSIFSIDGRTGAVRWRVAAAGARPPAIGVGGTVYIGTSGADGISPAILALDAATGAVRWSKNVPDQGGTHVDAARGTLFHVRRGAATAYDPSNGQVRWDFPVTNADKGFEGAVAGDGSLIVGITSNAYSGVASYDLAGARRWMNLEPAPRNLHSPPILDHEGTAYTAHDANREAPSAVFATNPLTGAVKWKLDFDRIESDLVVDADRTVYVIARITATSLYMLHGIRDGAIVSSESTRWIKPRSYHPLLIHPNGRVYYVTTDEVVFAPTAGTHPSAPWPMSGADAQHSRRR